MSLSKLWLVNVAGVCGPRTLVSCVCVEMTCLPYVCVLAVDRLGKVSKLPTGGLLGLQPSDPKEWGQGR